MSKGRKIAIIVTQAEASAIKDAAIVGLDILPAKRAVCAARAIHKITHQLAAVRDTPIPEALKPATDLSEGEE